MSGLTVEMAASGLGDDDNAESQDTQALCEATGLDPLTVRQYRRITRSALKVDESDNLPPPPVADSEDHIAALAKEQRRIAAEIKKAKKAAAKKVKKAAPKKVSSRDRIAELGHPRPSGAPKKDMDWNYRTGKWVDCIFEEE